MCCAILLADLQRPHGVLERLHHWRGRPQSLLEAFHACVYVKYFVNRTCISLALQEGDVIVDAVATRIHTIHIFVRWRFFDSYSGA